MDANMLGDRGTTISIMLFSSKVVEMVDLTGQVPNISKSYRLEIDGVPKPQARPRLGRYGFYNPRSKELAEFKSRVKEEVGCTIFSREQPVSVCIKFYMRRPNAHFKANKRCNALKAMMPFAVNRRPDIDNLIKFVLDGMNEVVYSDDAQVVKLVACKIYDSEGTCDGKTEILVEEFTGVY